MENQKVLSILDFGAAADGLADDTGALEQAAKEAEKSGLPLSIPRGSYRLTRPVVLRHITVVGHVSGAWCADAEVLPQLLVDHADGPAIVLESAGIAGVQIRQTAPLPESGGYPAIVTGKTGARISNMKISGCWDGIVCDDDLDNREGNPARLNIENVFMCNIHHVGVYVGGLLDVGCIRNVEVWSPGSKTFPQDGVGFHFRKNDGVHISDCFAFNAAIGFLFEEMYGKKDFNGGTLGWMTNCNVDYSGRGIVIRGKDRDEAGTCHYYPTQLSVNGGSFWCHYTGLMVESGKCRISVSSAEFRSNGAPAVDIAGGETVLLNSCFLTRVFEHEDCPAMRVSGGTRTVLNGCMLQSHNDGLELCDGAGSVALTGCAIEAQGEAVVGGRRAALRLDDSCILN